MFDFDFSQLEIDEVITITNNLEYSEKEYIDYFAICGLKKKIFDNYHYDEETGFIEDDFVEDK
jgi:predicted aldo/keto reductase-like oxidoreductase